MKIKRCLCLDHQQVIVQFLWFKTNLSKTTRGQAHFPQPGPHRVLTYLGRIMNLAGWLIPVSWLKYSARPSRLSHWGARWTHLSSAMQQQARMIEAHITNKQTNKQLNKQTGANDRSSHHGNCNIHMNWCRWDAKHNRSSSEDENCNTGAVDCLPWYYKLTLQTLWHCCTLVGHYTSSSHEGPSLKV